MSTINYTYNVIVDRFRQFAAGHFQLRRFTHGEISQADLEKEAEWPWMHIKPRAINYSPGTRTFSFELFICDLPRDKEDKTGYQAESITDCSLIFQDVINEIYLGNMFGDQVVLTRPVNSEPFVEQYTHTLTGVTGIIELSLDYDWSACSIPASWNYNTPTNSPNDGFGALQFIESLDQNGVFVSLLNDLEAPGNSYYYGTDAAGVKGWYAIVDNIGLTCETLPDCAVIISIEEDIAALQTDVALKANSADLGATAFSNSYNDLDNLPTIPAAQVNSDWNSTSGVSEILNKPTIPSIAGLVADTRAINTTSPIVGGGNLTADRTISIPAATASVSGHLTAADWTTFNGKQNALGFTPVPTTRTLTINGTTQDLSANRTFTIATGLTVGTTPITSGTIGSVLFQGTGNVLQQSANLFWDNTNARLGIGTAAPSERFHMLQSVAGFNNTLKMTCPVQNANIISFSNPDNSLQGSFLATGSTFGFGLYQANQTNLIGGAGGVALRTSNGANAHIRFHSGNANIDISPEIARFVASSGNLLLNTTTDAGFKLDVNGTFRALTGTTIASFGINTGQITYGSTNTSITGFANQFFIINSAAAGYIQLQAQGATGTVRFTAGSTSEIARFASTGSLLLNTTTDIASSQLTVESTTKGFLPPRMTSVQKNAIATPAAGLVVYDTTLGKLCVRGAAAWETITSL